MSKTTIVRKITSKEEKAHKKSLYPHAHRLADIAEIETFGQQQFDYINHKIQKLPRGHWAGTHTANHNIHISQELLNLVPIEKRNSFKAELKLHEKVEDKIMSKKGKRK